MSRKRYENVLEMLRGKSDEQDQPLVDNLEDHLASRTLVNELVARRAARGLSQQDMADRLGCKQGTISKLKAAADDRLNLGTLIRYAEALG